MSVLRRYLIGFASVLLSVLALPLSAQNADAPIQRLLQEHGEIIAKSSRKTIAPAIDALAASGLSEAQVVLERWQAKEMWRNKQTGLFVYGEKSGKELTAFDFADGAELGTFLTRDFKQLKPNSGIRGMIGAALVQFQLSGSVLDKMRALDAIERDAEASHLAALTKVLPDETDAAVRQRMERLERLLTIRFGQTEEDRIAAIQSFDGDLGVDARAALNPLIEVALEASAEVPEGEDIARLLAVGSEDLSRDAAYDILVAAGQAKPRISRDDKREALLANISDGSVAGIQVATLNTEDARDLAYAALANEGLVDPVATEAEVDETLAGFIFYERYTGSPAVAVAAAAVLSGIENKVAINQAVDLGLDALSLASIYFLAAIGLAITFGVMRVINMAHGEFIMMGAYTGYVVQQVIPDYTVSILVALPLAFAVTFGAGVAMERLVIRYLYHRPLETLLATFGISIALQQIAKNIFGTQAASPHFARLARRVARDQRHRFDQLYPDRDFRAGPLVPCAVPVRDEPHATWVGSAGRDAKPAHGGFDGDQPGPDQHADLRVRFRHCGDRGRGHRAICQSHVRDGR